MRRGLTIVGRIPVAGRAYIHPGEHFMGVPLTYDRRVGVAQAQGIFRWKRIAVGDMWFELVRDEQDAVLLHEYAHCKMFHMEQRLLMIPFFWTRWAASRAREQEFDADLFAADRGYGLEFIRFLRRYDMHDEFDFHAPNDVRIDRIMTRVQERLYANAVA